MGRTTTTGTGTHPKDDEIVLTPGGWRPKSTVHRIEPGHHLSGKDGRLRKIHTASGKSVADFGELSHNPHPPKTVTTKKVPGEDAFTDSGWILRMVQRELHSHFVFQYELGCAAPTGHPR
jgi:hypothetical protein